MTSIIIVNYKNEQKTIDYIKTELRKVVLPHIVVVVNNAATKESNEVLINGLTAALVKDIHQTINTNETCFVIPHEDNLGFAKGNNLGAKFSIQHFKIDYLLFSNNDLRFIDNNVVEYLVGKIKKLPTVGIIGPKVIGLDGESQSPEPYYSFGLRYFWRYWLPKFLSHNLQNRWLKFNYSENAGEGIHYKVMGSFFLVKAKDFLDCNMMDENTFLFAEEVILSERMKKINKEVYYDPAVVIVHEHGATISKNIATYRKNVLQFESESYYYHEYRNVPKFLIKMGLWSMKGYLLLKNRV